jgi:hypothetical protein
VRASQKPLAVAKVMATEESLSVNSLADSSYRKEGGKIEPYTPKKTTFQLKNDDDEFRSFSESEQSGSLTDNNSSMPTR